MASYDEFYLPDDLYYDPKDHLWTKIEGDKVRIGLDQFGQRAAGTVAYIKILPVGRTIAKLRAFGSLEAGKYIGPLRAQVAGTILEVNQEVLQDPRLVNEDPYGGAWFVVIQPEDLERDLADRVHGAENIQKWLEEQVHEYREKGLFAEK